MESSPILQEFDDIINPMHHAGYKCLSIIFNVINTITHEMIGPIDESLMEQYVENKFNIDSEFQIANNGNHEYLLALTCEEFDGMFVEYGNVITKALNENTHSYNLSICKINKKQYICVEVLTYKHSQSKLTFVKEKNITTTIASEKVFMKQLYVNTPGIVDKFGQIVL